MIKLSVIIAIYNVEKYVAQCLESVFHQDLHDDEYEVICVNDGSIDSSPSIVEQFKSHHTNLILINHPKNLKLGVARNTGRSFARGKYIWYVDADDWILPNCMAAIIDKCEEDELDVLEFSYLNYQDSQYRSNRDPSSLKEDHVYSGVDYLERFHINHLGRICGIWRRVYRKGFLDENCIQSPPINMGEDEPFGIEVFLKASRFAYVDKDYYVYRINETSLTGGKRNIVNAFRLYEASTECPRYMIASLNSSECAHDEILEKLNAMIRYDINYAFLQLPKLPMEEQDKLRQLYRKSFMNNLFLFTYLGKRRTMDYLLWLVFNRKPNYVQD